MLTRILFVAFCFVATSIQAQNFPKEMKKQEAAIEAAYKKKSITIKEYEKLKSEQEVIRQTYEKFNMDDILTSAEKNKLASKLQRAANRLRKYQNNRERY